MQRDLEVGDAPCHAEPRAQQVPPLRLDVELPQVPPEQRGGPRVAEGAGERFVGLEDHALAGRSEHAGEVLAEALALEAADLPGRLHRGRGPQSSSATRPSSDRGST